MLSPGRSRGPRPRLSRVAEDVPDGPSRRPASGTTDPEDRASYRSYLGWISCGGPPFITYSDPVQRAKRSVPPQMSADTGSSAKRGYLRLGGWLRDKTVVVFESRFPRELAGLLERRGAVVVCAPSMREVAAPDSPSVIGFVRDVANGDLDAVVFLTGVGCRICFESAESLGLSKEFRQGLSAMVSVCRGPKPVAVLRRAGLAPTAVAPEPHTTEQLVGLLQEMQSELVFKRVALQHYGEDNVRVRQVLESMGCTVSDVRPYRWALPEDVSALERGVQMVVSGEVDAVCFTSSPQVANVVAVAERMGLLEDLKVMLANPAAPDAVAAPHGVSNAAGEGSVAAADHKRVVVAAVGPVAAKALRDLGARVDVEPERPKMADFVRALDALEERASD